MQVFTQGSGDHQGASLWYAWGRVWDHDVFILWDLVSTHNFVLQDMVAKLIIHSLRMGLKKELEGAFEGQQVPITPMIGKLQIQVQGYVDNENFYISLFKHANVF